MNRACQFVVQTDSQGWLSTIQYSLESQEADCRVLETSGLSQWLNHIELFPTAVALIEISRFDEHQLEQVKAARQRSKLRSCGGIMVAVGELKGVADAGFALKTLLCFGFDLYCPDQQAWRRELPRLLRVLRRTPRSHDWETADRATIERGMLERLPWS
jgi:hypothetical protein